MSRLGSSYLRFFVNLFYWTGALERHETTPQEKKDAYQVRIPMQRWGTPQDIAEAVL